VPQTASRGAFIMEGPDNQILREAILRNSALVVSLPSAGLLRHHRSRFVGLEDTGFWIGTPAGEETLIDELIASERAAGVSFKNGETKVVFASLILQRCAEHVVHGQLKLPALFLRHPEEIKSIQRRNNYRVRVPEDERISVKIWRLGPGVPLRDKPSTRQQLKVKLRDLSIGGVGVFIVGDEGKPPVVSIDDRLRVELTTENLCMLIEGQLRHPIPPVMGDTVRAGIQFKSLEKDLQGRQIMATLTRIVGELHRDEIRRYRMGITAA
jgi:c-di-GMP-binding flagellar brake protein YcgR